MSVGTPIAESVSSITAKNATQATVANSNFFHSEIRWRCGAGESGFDRFFDIDSASCDKVERPVKNLIPIGRTRTLPEGIIQQNDHYPLHASQMTNTLYVQPKADCRSTRKRGNPTRI